jgi:hypothetical protein
MAKCVSDIYDRQYHNTDLDGEGLGPLSRLPPVMSIVSFFSRRAGGEWRTHGCDSRSARIGDTIRTCRNILTSGTSPGINI